MMISMLKKSTYPVAVGVLPRLMGDPAGVAEGVADQLVEKQEK